MRAILIGHGASARVWLNRLKSVPRGVVVAIVDGGADSVEGMPAAFATLGEALEHVQAESALLVGRGSLKDVTHAFDAGLPVVVTNPEVLSREELRDLTAAASRSGGNLLAPRLLQYRRCRGMIRRFLRSGWLGAIGHVSCIDRRQATADVTDPVGPNLQVCRYGASQLIEICELFDSRPERVMSRFAALPESGSCTEAFLSLRNGIDIHYFGSTSVGPANGVHELWIEGAQGSLKANGKSVWWRKRGWPVFVPVGGALPVFGSGDSTGLNHVAQLIDGRAASQGVSSVVELIAAAAQSERRRQAVSLVDDAGRETVQ